MTEVIKYCGYTDEITSMGYPSCEYAYCSYVFAVLTGVTIGAISLSNIIGVAYVKKRATITWLVSVAALFEGIGMLSMSRLTLDQTVTNTLKISDIQNLRLGFIALGSTQLTSCLILINVLIFALPMSTTQVVISGLTGVAFIYFPTETGYPMWFFYEVGMWIVCPIGGMALAWLLHSAVE